jgi:hypothetical protein
VAGVVRLTNLPPSCAVVMKSGNLNFLEPSGPLQACNGTALPLPDYFILFEEFQMKIHYYCHTCEIYIRLK